MLLAILALAMFQSLCPVHVGVNKQGDFFVAVFSGWTVASTNNLERHLQQGCRTNSFGPAAPVTSLFFSAEPQAPGQKLEEVEAILARNGWPKEKLTLEPWNTNFRKLSGRFYIDKPIFSIGEPVLLHFEITNSGSEPYWVNTTGLPGMPLCSGFNVQVLGPDKKTVATDRLVRANTCVLNGQMKHAVIDPGEKYTLDIDLGLYLDLSVKGSYVIRAQHDHLRWNRSPADPLDSEAILKIKVQ